LRLIISSTLGRGYHWFIVFDFQQLLLLAKIDLTSGYGDKNARKADKYILFQIVLAYISST
jgi:hypothetical protein